LASAKEGGQALARGGAVRAVGVLPDDVHLAAGVAAESLLGEIAGGLGLRPRRVVAGVVLTASAEPRPMVSTMATSHASTIVPRRR